MKQCPQCKRTYSGDLNFCLDDGTRLASQDDNATWVYPQPSVPAPAPRPHRRGLWIIGVIVIVVAIVGVIGGVAAIAWFSTQDRFTAQNVNSPQRLSDASPSPTPLPSPSPSVAEFSEQTLTGGTYQCEVNRSFKSEDREGSGTLKLQLTFNSDGTYFEQGYITIHGTEIKDRLGLEEKGRYTQADDFLIFNERLGRHYDRDSESWSSWEVPKDGSEDRERIRNVTPTTFQIYDADEKAWFTFSKL